MAMFSIKEKYTILKIISSEKGYNCYLAKKMNAGESENSQVFVINEITDRSFINKYIAEIISLKEKDMPEFVEYFTEQSCLYAVFTYCIGNSIQEVVTREKLSFAYRLSLAKEVIFKLTQYPAASSLMKCTAVFPENIIVQDGGIRFNFKLCHLEEDLTAKDSFYRCFASLLEVIFNKSELTDNAALKIVYEKCQKSINRTLGELLRDIEFVSSAEEKGDVIQKAVNEKKGKLKQHTKKITILCTIVAICIFGYQKWAEHNRSQAVYVNVDTIGTVDLIGAAEPNVDGEEIFVEANKKNNRKENEIPEEEKMADTKVPEIAEETVPEEVEADDGWLTDANGGRYKIHTVIRGENLVNIVKAFYENYSYRDVIRVSEYNRLPNPNVIRVGIEIMLPEKNW